MPPFIYVKPPVPKSKMNPKFPIFLEKKEFAILAVNKFLKLFLKKRVF
jgi:hypothetical protein